jgi:hypothetical protein
MSIHPARNHAGTDGESHRLLRETKRGGMEIALNLGYANHNRRMK